MKVSDLLVKLKLRVNKLDSKDYDNLENWKLLEAFNRASLLWVRQNLHGGNIYKEGNEQSLRRIDDLNLLIKEKEILYSKKDNYIITAPYPNDYLEYKRIDLYVDSDCCENEKIVVYLTKSADKNIIERSETHKASFLWRETFAISENKRFKIAIPQDEDNININKVVLIYFRKPVTVKKAGEFDMETGAVAVSDVDPEFNDDVVEVLIDYTASLIGADIIDPDIMQLRTQTSQNTN